MRSQTIGPLPLTGGLQLQVPEGKPSGLFRALNVEARDGFCQTRRGASLRSAIVPLTGENATLHPANWTATMVGAIGFDTIPPVDSEMVFALFPVNNNIAVDGAVVAEFYGADGAWHPFSYENVLTASGFWLGIADAANGAALYAIVPYGWVSATPAGFPSPKFWLRFTRTDANWVTGGLSANRFTIQSSAQFPQPLILSFKARDGHHDIVISCLDFGAIVTAGSAWNAIDLDLGLANEGGRLPLSVTDGYLDASLGPSLLNDGSPASAVYIPSTDDVLMAVSGVYARFKPNASDGPSGTQVTTLFNPDVAEQYADLGCESSLPPNPRAMCLFGGRVFLGGTKADPTLLQWSAPNEFWTTWPSANVAHLGGGGAGSILAMIPIAETLFIFTTTSIWRAILADPSEGNESNLFLNLVEETPCSSARSVVAVGNAIVFLSSDGVRTFNGQRSKLLANGVRDLFRPDSDHPYACMRKDRAVGVWHQVENQYRLAYPTAGAKSNDTQLVIDLDDNTAWLWGSDFVLASETSGASGPIGQRARGVRAEALCWSSRAQRVLALDPEGLVYYQDAGPSDLGDAITWYLESQTLLMATAKRATLGEVVIQVQRENFGSFKLGGIPDGDSARQDLRTVTPDPDRLSTSTAIDPASLASPIAPLQLRGSIAPARARLRLAGRNFRIRAESIAPTHLPVRAVSIAADVTVDDRGR